MNGAISNWTPGKNFDCPCGRRHEIRTKDISSGAGAVEGLKDHLKLHDGAALAIFDDNTFDVAGMKVRKALGASSREFIFKTGKKSLPADVSSLSKLEAELKIRRPAIAIAVGSGVINDLVKIAAKNFGIPYISIPTAPSMDGYLSANAALLDGGLKKQLNNLNPPIALLSDTDIVSTAPDKMIRAGLGDAFGKFTSITEWRINNAINGEYYCSDGSSLLLDEIDALLATSEKSDLRSKELVEALMRVLLMTGMVMQATGVSAVASCGEHYISHALEMRGYAVKGHAPSLHGLQVAWGAQIVLEAYGRVANGFLKEHPLDLKAMRHTYESHRKDWKTAGVDIDKAIDGKMTLLENCGPRLDQITEEPCAEYVSWLLKQSKRLLKVYADLGLPLNYAALGINREEASFAIRHAGDIRQRLCVFDLLHCHQTMDDFEQSLK